MDRWGSRVNAMAGGQKRKPGSSGLAGGGGALKNISQVITHYYAINREYDVDRD